MICVIRHNFSENNYIPQEKNQDKVIVNLKLLERITQLRSQATIS